MSLENLAPTTEDAENSGIREIEEVTAEEIDMEEDIPEVSAEEIGMKEDVSEEAVERVVNDVDKLAELETVNTQIADTQARIQSVDALLKKIQGEQALKEFQAGISIVELEKAQEIREIAEKEVAALDRRINAVEGLIGQQAFDTRRMMLEEKITRFEDKVRFLKSQLEKNSGAFADEDVRKTATENIDRLEGLSVTLRGYLSEWLSHPAHESAVKAKADDMDDVLAKLKEDKVEIESRASSILHWHEGASGIFTAGNVEKIQAAREGKQPTETVVSLLQEKEKTLVAELKHLMDIKEEKEALDIPIEVEDVAYDIDLSELEEIVAEEKTAQEEALREAA